MRRAIFERLITEKELNSIDSYTSRYLDHTSAREVQDMRTRAAQGDAAAEKKYIDAYVTYKEREAEEDREEWDAATEKEWRKEAADYISATKRIYGYGKAKATRFDAKHSTIPYKVWQAWKKELKPLSDKDIVSFNDNKAEFEQTGVYGNKGQVLVGIGLGVNAVNPQTATDKEIEMALKPVLREHPILQDFLMALQRGGYDYTTGRFAWYTSSSYINWNPTIVLYIEIPVVKLTIPPTSAKDILSEGSLVEAKGDAWEVWATFVQNFCEKEWNSFKYSVDFSTDQRFESDSLNKSVKKTFFLDGTFTFSKRLPEEGMDRSHSNTYSGVSFEYTFSGELRCRQTREDGRKGVIVDLNALPEKDIKDICRLFWDKAGTNSEKNPFSLSKYLTQNFPNTEYAPSHYFTLRIENGKIFMNARFTGLGDLANNRIFPPGVTEGAGDVLFLKSLLTEAKGGVAEAWLNTVRKSLKNYSVTLNYNHREGFSWKGVVKADLESTRIYTTSQGSMFVFFDVYFEGDVKEKGRVKRDDVLKEYIANIDGVYIQKAINDLPLVDPLVEPGREKGLNYPAIVFSKKRDLVKSKNPDTVGTVSIPITYVVKNNIYPSGVNESVDDTIFLKSLLTEAKGGVAEAWKSYITTKASKMKYPVAFSTIRNGEKIFVKGEYAFSEVLLTVKEDYTDLSVKFSFDGTVSPEMAGKKLEEFDIYMAKYDAASLLGEQILIEVNRKLKNTVKFPRAILQEAIHDGRDDAIYIRYTIDTLLEKNIYPPGVSEGAGDTLFLKSLLTEARGGVAEAWRKTIEREIEDMKIPFEERTAREEITGELYYSSVNVFQYGKKTKIHINFSFTKNEVLCYDLRTYVKQKKKVDAEIADVLYNTSLCRGDSIVKYTLLKKLGFYGIDKSMSYVDIGGTDKTGHFVYLDIDITNFIEYNHYPAGMSESSEAFLYLKSLIDLL
jgi:hypothetical protein